MSSRRRMRSLPSGRGSKSLGGQAAVFGSRTAGRLATPIACEHSLES
jgi:hypothetical protein